MLENILSHLFHTTTLTQEREIHNFKDEEMQVIRSNLFKLLLESRYLTKGQGMLIL